MRKYTHDELKFYRYKSDPVILILSGTHGDESAITKLVLNHLQKNQDKLPSFLFIPAISPDAVRLNTRTNEAGVDVNRNYFRNSPHVNIQTSMEVIERYKYELCIDFHMDLFTNAFYMYDSHQLPASLLTEFRKELKKQEIPLLNGIDDETDPMLNKKFVDGYYVDKEGVPGSTWNWLLDENLAKRIINPEIPGKTSRDKMDLMIGLFFKKILIPLVTF